MNPKALRSRALSNREFSEATLKATLNSLGQNHAWADTYINSRNRTERTPPPHKFTICVAQHFYFTTVNTSFILFLQNSDVPI